MPKLKPQRREDFAQYLAKGMTQVEAYKRAGFAKNDSNAAKLANKPEVVARVTEITGRALAKTEVTIQEIDAALIAIGLGDPRSLATWGEGRVRLKDSDELTDGEAKLIRGIKQGKYGPELTMVDRLPALLKLREIREKIEGLQSQSAEELAAMSMNEVARRLLFMFTSMLDDRQKMKLIEGKAE